MQKVTDVKAYLESDLNPSGVESVSDVIAEISADVPPINAKIQSIVDALDELAARIEANKPPPEPVEGD